MDSFLATPRRVAVAGDWHADTDYAVGAIARAGARAADVIVQLGDFGYTFRPAYLDSLDAALAEEGLVLGFVDGNHEDFDWLLQQPIADDGLRYLRERIVHLPRGLRWQWGQLRCLAVGGSCSLDKILRTPHTSWWPQEALSADEVGAITAAGGAEVMFCHDCPAGIAVPGSARREAGVPPDELRATAENRDRIRMIVDAVRPIRLWHGHFHQRYQSLLDAGDYRTVIDGLGRNSDPIDNNMVVVDVAALGRHVAVTPASGDGRVNPFADADAVTPTRPLKRVLEPRRRGETPA